MNDRCEWSDLPTLSCAHCGADPGTRPVIGPAVPPREPQPRDEPTTTLERPRLPETWAPSNGAGECRCGRPTQDGAWLCGGCEARFTNTLGELPDLDVEISLTITRQRAAALTGGPRAVSEGLPWHDRAAEARRTLHGLLVSWVRFCTEEDVRGPAVPEPEDRIDSLAAWLVTRVHGLTLLDIGPEAMDEITDAAAECHRIVFWKRKNRIYLGTCGVVSDEPDKDGVVYVEPCPGEVYAEEGEPVGHCDLCSQGQTVVIRKSEIDKRLDDRLCTPAEIATYAVHLGLDVPRDQVRRRVNYWHRHKRIVQRGTAENGDPMFRYGEVRNELYADFARRVS